MKICILSDSHDNRKLLRAAVEHAVEHGAEVILHAGDVVAPSTFNVLKDFDLPIHVVHGNNMGDTLALVNMSRRKGSLVNYHGQDATLELHGRKIFMVHYPHYARGMACTGDYDIVICGHSHRTDIEMQENIKNTETVYIDAGTVGGVAAPPTYVLGDLEQMTFEIVTVQESGNA